MLILRLDGKEQHMLAPERVNGVIASDSLHDHWRAPAAGVPGLRRHVVNVQKPRQFGQVLGSGKDHGSPGLKQMLVSLKLRNFMS